MPICQALYTHYAVHKFALISQQNSFEASGYVQYPALDIPAVPESHASWLPL